jgi:hypothetical protein
VLHGVLDSNFKLCVFVVIGLIKGEIEKPSGQFLGLNSNLGQFQFVFLLSLFRLKNRVCLSHIVQVVGAPWRAVMRIVAGVRDLVQRIGDGRTGRVLSGRAVERSGGPMYGLHRARENEEHVFLS